MTDISKWNTIATEYTDWLENQKDKKGFAFNKALTDAILRRLPTNENFSLLDLGCGDGSLLNIISNRYAKVLGVDGAEKMIEIARKKYPHLAKSFLVDDITKQFPIDDNSFDVVVCNMVLMDLKNIETTISEIHRVLKCDEVFILTTNHPSFSFVSHHLSNPDKRYIDNFHYEKTLDTTFNSLCNNYHRPIQFYIEQLLNADLTIKGFKEISIDTNGQEELKKYHLTANALLIESHKLC